jgi:hypothetical protein
MEPAQETSSPDAVKPVKTGFFGSAWADIGAAVITVSSGAVAAWRSINKSFYHNVKIDPGIKEQICVSKRQTEEILRDVKNTADPVEKRLKLLTRLPAQHQSHEKAMDEMLARDYEIKTIADRVRLLRPHQKLEVLVTVGATMGVALGAMITLASNRRSDLKQQALEKRIDAGGQSRQP